MENPVSGTLAVWVMKAGEDVVDKRTVTGNPQRSKERASRGWLVVHG